MVLKDNLSNKDQEVETKEIIMNDLYDDIQKKEKELFNLRAINLEWQKAGVDKYNNLLGNLF